MEQIIEALEENLEEAVKMGMALWPDAEYEDLNRTFRRLLQSDKGKLLLYVVDGAYAAFVYVSIRIDYVEGSDSSPTGFIEGIYVRPEYRRNGISRRLVAEGEKWLKLMGCKQVGSDIHIDNQASYDFHTSIGFKEAGRLIAFIKDL